MVLFNDPVRCPNPCERAVRLAIEMRAAVESLELGWRRFGHELGFGVGIAHGYATLGCLGFENRYEYSAIGTVVNLAARLCGEAESGQILVDRKVRAAIGGLAEMEAVGELSLKGFRKGVQAFILRRIGG